MRKSLIAIVSMAAAVAALSCTREVEFKDNAAESTPEAGAVTINVLSGNDETRTMAVDVEGGVPVIQWVSTDKVKLFEVVDGTVQGVAESAGAVIDGDGKASFTTTLNWDDAAGSEYVYSAVYPSDAVVQNAETGDYYLVLPDEQHLVRNNFSVDSDVLFTVPLDHGDSRVTNDEDVMFSFRRLGSVIRLRLKGVVEDELIKQVTLTAPVNMAGSIAFDPVLSITDAGSAFAEEASNIITLTLDDFVATGDDVVWFRVMAEEDWASGQVFSLEVLTDKAVYQKEVTLPREIKFPEGGLTKFSVDLSSSRESLAETVLYECDFEGADSVADWTFIDADGDGNQWSVMDNSATYVYSGTYALVSRSYNSGPLTPDNWAFTPAVQLTEDNYLSFWVRAQDLQWQEEHYGVYITDEAPAATNLANCAVLMEETEFPSGAVVELGPDSYEHFVIRIPEEYKGKTVYVGFRHFNCTDMFRFNLDLVSVTEGYPSLEPVTVTYGDYLGEWQDSPGHLVTIEQKVAGVSYTITGLTGLEGYPVEALFSDGKLVVNEQVVNTSGSTDVALQGYVTWTDPSMYTDYSTLGENVLFRAFLLENGTMKIISDHNFSYYVLASYTDQTYTDFSGGTAIPSKLEPYVAGYIFMEDFEDGTDGWSVYDVDNDGYGWGLASGYAHSGNYMLYSESYVSGVGALTPDNYVLTPTITLSSGNYLSFWVTDYGYLEHFGVCIMTDESDATIDLLQEYDTDKTGDYSQVVLQIPAGYDNKTVYIGFRHFDCTDGWYLFIDDVAVTNFDPSSASLSAPARRIEAPVMQDGMARKDVRRDAPKQGWNGFRTPQSVSPLLPVGHIDLRRTK